MSLFKKEMPESVRGFIEHLRKYDEEQRKLPPGERNIFPVGTDAQTVVNCLKDVFLGEGWYIGAPVSTKQTNTLILDEILYNYCKEYRKAAKNN